MFSESNDDTIKWRMDSRSYKDLIIKRETADVVLIDPSNTTHRGVETDSL